MALNWSFRKSAANLTKVSMTMTKHLLSKQEYKKKNVVFSPLSLQTVLNIITAGCEGRTQRQLLSFLRSESSLHLNSFSSHLLFSVLNDAAPFGGPHLSFANSVWVEQSQPLLPSFKQIVTTNYKAALTSVDFLNKADEVTEEVNLWVKKETNGLIKEILPQGSVDSLTKLIFTNALYFKGAWNKKFDGSKTKDYDFHLLNGSSVKVPFMRSNEKQFIDVFDDFKVLCLPYNNGSDKRQFSMYFFLPNAKDGLSTLVEKVVSESYLLEQKLCVKQVEVGNFRIPKFNISFELEATNMLKELGVVLPFVAGDFTKMVDSLEVGKTLYVSDIFHKSVIKVNEEGTEAAAATSCTMMMKHISFSPQVDFVADHPFLFLIKEDLSGTILFVGQMHNPLAG